MLSRPRDGEHRTSMPYAEGTRSVTAQGPGKDGTRAPYPYGSRSDGVPTKSKLLTSGVHCPAGRFPIRPKILAILTVFEASWRAREFETSPTVPCADRVTGMRLVPLPPSSTEVHEVVIVLCCTRMSCPDATDASIWPNWTVGVSMLTVHETGNFTRTADGKGIETVGDSPTH